MKVILFGASKAGENYISNHPNIKVLAFADNDSAKHGSSFMGYPVIAPTDISSYDIDNVIITSQWIDQIHSQLTNDLRIPKAKVIVPSKQAVKAALPFEDKGTLSFAQTLLRTLNRFCQTRDIVFCLDSGTLLGAVRDKGLIAWDDDIDLAVDKTNFAKLQSALPELSKMLTEQFDVDWNIVIINVNGIDSCINLEFANSSTSAYVQFDVSIQCRESLDGYSELLSSGGLFFAPAKHFDNYEPITFLDETFLAPFDKEGFLTFMYGAWETPKKTTQITEYENRRASMPSPKGGIKIQKRTITAKGI